MTAYDAALSIYSTYLEIVVIQAICLSCSTSAVIMTALLWVSAAVIWR